MLGGIRNGGVEGGKKLIVARRKKRDNYDCGRQYGRRDNSGVRGEVELIMVTIRESRRGSSEEGRRR